MADITGKKPSEFSQATVVALQLKLNQIPVLTNYPTTDATKAGTRFWYKGNEWHYMTQAEIDSCEWTGLVNVGFPAPFSKVFNSYIFTNGYLVSATGVGVLAKSTAPANSFVDFLGLGLPNKSFKVDLQLKPILQFKNANLLINLLDVGTSLAAVFSSCSLSATTINSFLTDLPPTTQTVTIDVSANPGSATCTPTIGTAKGYIVKTT